MISMHNYYSLLVPEAYETFRTNISDAQYCDVGKLGQIKTSVKVELTKIKHQSHVTSKYCAFNEELHDIFNTAKNTDRKAYKNNHYVGF